MACTKGTKLGSGTLTLGITNSTLRPPLPRPESPKLIVFEPAMSVRSKSLSSCVLMAQSMAIVCPGVPAILRDSAYGFPTNCAPSRMIFRVLVPAASSMELFGLPRLCTCRPETDLRYSGMPFHFTKGECPLATGSTDHSTV